MLIDRLTDTHTHTLHHEALFLCGRYFIISITERHNALMIYANHFSSKTEVDYNEIKSISLGIPYIPNVNSSIRLAC